MRSDDAPRFRPIGAPASPSFRILTRRRQTLVAVILALAAVTALVIELPTRPSFDAHWRLLDEQQFARGLSPVWSVYVSKSANPEQNRLERYVAVSAGVLELKTNDDAGSGLCWCNGSEGPVRYGRWEISARFIPGAGHGDAILLWPANEDWPAGGEIDLSEVHSDGAFASETTATLHYSRANHEIIGVTIGNFAQWTTYAVEWLPSSVRVWVGNELVLSVDDPADIPHTPMFLALQAGPDTTVKVPNAQAELQVRWVKYFAS